MTETKNEIRVAKNHKDRLFRMIFREKKELLSLYNAVNGTSYTNAEDLEIVTLENAIYMNMKNDLAFIMDSYLNLYEHRVHLFSQHAVAGFVLYCKRTAGAD